MRSLARGWLPDRAQYNLRRPSSREDADMQGFARMVGSFGKTVLLAVLLVLLCAACDRSAEVRGKSDNDIEPITTSQGEKEGDTSNPGGASVERVEVSTLATDLEVPWSFAFLPGGDALVTERDSGKLLRVSPSGDVREIQTLPEGGSGEGGLLGVAVSPDYEDDSYIYAYYTTEEDNRVVRFRMGETPEPILTGIPVNTYHDGGRIKFGPDGMLYVSTGDAGDAENSQDRNSLGGKILRIEPDGSIPPDNPFPDNPVYSYGHRNVEGLAWDARGQLYASEFGQNTWDEVNRVEAGENYGWPEVEGVGGGDRYIDPIATFSTSEASPSGAAILRNGAIPQWEGDFFTASLRGQRLWRLKINEGSNVTEREALLQGEAGRLRHVAQAPDGSLWVLT